MYVYGARVDRVVDGDTLDTTVDLGFGIQLFQRIRLLGINCPEHGTPEGDAATAYTRTWVADHGPTFILRTELDRREKFGRVLGMLISGARTLNEDLIAAGHAVRYDGGHRTLPGQQGEPAGVETVR
ncbi:thermonuclease family protein [Streptomyces olivaceoviridis]|uniref:thermonuclease family protein n=1 Tax=Streptomyces olivaceoviridis TaxID=1921 RepID=UPI0036C9FBA0